MPKPKPPIQRFQATLEHAPNALGWIVARVPFAPATLGAMIRLRVRGDIASPAARAEPHPFRTSLFPDPRGGFFLLVNRTMQTAAGIHPGDLAVFHLQADLDPRPAELPDELAPLLDEDPALRPWYDALSESTRRELAKWIDAVSSPESRLRRAEQAAERLLLTMEAEHELPPAIQLAFRQRPRARTGWQLLTPAQRRAELMGVFYYRTPEARDRRIAKLCDLAEARATKASSP
jgi:hypothetical protein